MPLQRSLQPRGIAGISRALDRRMVVVRLFDAYAGLLTARQQAVLRMYYHEDLSLGEIAARAGVSRQAVFDSLRRSVAELEHLEARIGVLAGRNRADRVRDEVRTRLLAVEHAAAHLAAAGEVELGPLRRALRALRDAL